jgi:hypothetical protein
MPLIAGDLDHELLLDRLDHPFDLAPPHRPSRLAVGQLHAEHRAGPLQRHVGITRAVVAVQAGGNAVGGDRGAQRSGEPDRVRAADEPGPGQEPGPVVDDDGQVACPAADGRPVHQVRGPDFVHRAGLEPAERLRRPPARPGVQLAGGEPALDRPLRRHLARAQPGDQDAADLRRGPGRVLHLQPGRELDYLIIGARRALPRLGHQRLEPAVAARDDPPVQGPPRYRDLPLPVRPLVLAGRQVPHDRPALPRCQGRIHRRLDQRPPPQRYLLRALPAGRGLPVRCRHDCLQKMPGS